MKFLLFCFFFTLSPLPFLPAPPRNLSIGRSADLRLDNRHSIDDKTRGDVPCQSFLVTIWRVGGGGKKGRDCHEGLHGNPMRRTIGDAIQMQAGRQVGRQAQAAE